MLYLFKGNTFELLTQALNSHPPAGTVESDAAGHDPE
jgi:hypothetical protein